MSPGTVACPCMIGLALSGAGAGPGGEAWGPRGMHPTEGLGPTASEPPGARASEMSPDGGEACHRCTNACLSSLGRRSLR